MKNLFLSLLSCSFLTFGIQTAHAQLQTHEIGVRTSSLTSFDFIYKKGKTDTKFTRYRVGLTNALFQNTQENQVINIAFGFSLGWERRKSISEELKFIHGFEPSIFYGISSNEGNYNMNIIPGIGYVLGFQYDISNKFYVSIESIPTLSGLFFIDEDGLNDDYALQAGFNSNAVALSFVYTFKNEKAKWSVV